MTGPYGSTQHINLIAPSMGFAVVQAVKSCHVLLQAREQQAGVVNIRSDDDLEPDELLGQFSSRDAEKVCCARRAWTHRAWAVVASRMRTGQV